MKEATINNILDIGIAIISKKGYHNVGLNEILTLANIPKGSFYYYFKSKEDFGLKVINHYAEKSAAHMVSFLTDQQYTPKQRFINLFDERKQEYTTDQYISGCLLGNCSNELTGESVVFQQMVDRKFKLWHSILCECIAEGQALGEFNRDFDPDEMSNFLLNNWEGALLRMKASKSIKPFQLFVDMSMKILQ